MHCPPCGAAKRLVLVAVAIAGAFCLSAGEWERPRTTRRYLQPPMSERLFVLYNDAKIDFAEVIHDHAFSNRHYKTEMADVCWFLRGGKFEPLDFKTAENLIPEDGTPLHGLKWKLPDGVEVRLETCCDAARKTTCHGRFTVANVGRSAYREQFSVRVRHGLEWVILGCDRMAGAPDYYQSYKSVPGALEMAPLTWRPEGNALVSAEGRFMTFDPVPGGASWNRLEGSYVFSVDLAAGETFTFDFALGIGTPARPCYDHVVDETRRLWQREFAKMTRLPERISSDSASVRLAKNMLVQMLQCFSRPVGRDYVLPRQGGLQRWVWPWDNAEALIALPLLGEYDDYVKDAVDFYFGLYAGNRCGDETGRMGPFGYDWDCNTANCLGILGRYVLDAGDSATWKKYREPALAAFRWIMRHRVKTATKTLVAGLFPAGRASDYEGSAQVWGFTDCENLKGIRPYLDAAERLGDPAVEEIRAGTMDYAAAVGRVLEQAKRDSEGKPGLYLPLTPDGTDGAALPKGYPREHYALVARVGLMYGMLDKDDVRRIWQDAVVRGVVSTQGLTGNLPPYGDLDSTHYWYTTSSDNNWHLVLKAIGDDRQAEIVRAATLRYAMTEEYYVGERYKDDDPWFLPWSPNASGSGRIIQMLLEDR